MIDISLNGVMIFRVFITDGESNDYYTQIYSLEVIVCGYELLAIFLVYHDDVIKWEHFPRYGPLWGEFTGHRCPWTNNQDAGDLIRHRAHYDITTRTIS